MNGPYPTSAENIGPWAAGNAVTVAEARFRFAQYGVLRAVADSRTLSETLVFKGGNALDFVWQPNRSTRDLDFSCKLFLDGVRLQALLTDSLRASSRRTGVTYRLQRFEKQPPAPESTFVTYMVKVGYALSADRRNRERIARGDPVSTFVPLDVSLNEPICGYVRVDVAGTYPLLVSSLEDIIAEKLRALLQQPVRNRHRRQDVLDIAVVLRERPGFDVDQVAEFLLAKAHARHVPVSRAAFRDEAVRWRAESDYAALQQTTRRLFIPFPEAYEAVLGLVTRLNIPDAGL